VSQTGAYLLYFVFALGAGAVYLLMPRGEESKRGAGTVLGLAALLGLLVLSALKGPHGPRANAFVYVFSLIAIAAAARVVTHPKPVYSAIYFVLVVAAVAGLLVLDGSEFLAVALVIIYAGAILVTYLFVIMLAQQPGSPTYDRRAREPFLGVVVGFLLMGSIAAKTTDLPDRSGVAPSPTAIASASSTDGSNTLGIGGLVMTKYVVALELSGVLLLISMVGAIALSRKRVPAEPYIGAHLRVGIAGKEVEPF